MVRAPTYSELYRTVADLMKENKAERAEFQATVDRLEKRVGRLEQENATLRSRLDKNSKNSSKPPSSDGFSKPASRDRSLRESSGKPPGKQAGSSGVSLPMTSSPDRVLRHEPTTCRGCGSSLHLVSGTIAATRQVIDLPPIRVETVEHQRIEKLCRCETVTTGVFPADVKCSVSYGPRVHAVGAYLLNVHYLPVARTAAVFKDLFQLPVSTGWVSSLGQKTSTLLADTLVLIKQAVTASTVAHVDETGLRVAGGLSWVHSASTTTHSMFHVDAKRGLAGTLKGGVLQSFTGVMVHDGWEPYKTFTAATHGLCNAHHLRELKKISEDTPELGWAKQMTEILVATHRQVQAAKARGDTSLSKETLEAIRHGYGEILTAANVQSPARVHPKTGGRIAQTEPRRLLNRLGPYQDDVLRFATDFTVPFDNNQAERDIRMVKLRQKISGCLRSTTGAEHFVSIRSVLSTARKQAVNEFEVLLDAFTGNSWIPALP